MFRRDKFWLRELERREREWAAERKELLDRIMFLADRPMPSEQPFTLPAEPNMDFSFPEIGVIE